MFPLVPDLPRALLAIVFFSLIALAPGWAAGYWLDLLAFRRRFFTMRLAIGAAASVAVGPIVLVLVARPMGMRAAAVAAGAMAVAGIVTFIFDMTRRRPGRARSDARRI